MTLRLFLLGVCIILAAVRGEAEAVPWIAALGSTAAALSFLARSDRWILPGLFVETTVAAAAAAGTGGALSPMFPYLLAPAFHGGTTLGISGTVPQVPLAAAVLAVGGALAERIGGVRNFAVASVEWVLLSLAVGLIAAWARRLRLVPATQTEDSYVAAYRLLSQLRTVARHLSGGLDAAALGQDLLSSLRGCFAFDRAAVFVRGSGDRLMPLVHVGDDPVNWNSDLGTDSPFAEAWMSQQAQWTQRPLSPGVRTAANAVVVPLRIGLRTFGVVGLERLAAPDGIPDLPRLQAVADEAALRLETALLFNEVREIATAEERRRLSREIHDGIAQELASFGYLIDAIAADAGDSRLAGDLARLRQELSRILSEIRLSIFDLRSEVDQHGGLGAALSEYVRSVGTSSRLTVHLSLDEGPARLPVGVEAELLRIAQEAITNARKHAGADNLWVECMVDPPLAHLRVEDDGVGLQRGREDSFGIEIMRERAARLRANLAIQEREPHGTVVEVIVGSRSAADTVAATRKR